MTQSLASLDLMPDNVGGDGDGDDDGDAELEKDVDNDAEDDDDEGELLDIGELTLHHLVCHRISLRS